MLKKIIASLGIILALLIGFISNVQAQQADYRLNVHRNFGFSSGSQIRGSFNLDITPLVNIKSVTYLIDGTEISKVSTSPFTLTIQTSTFANGMHELSAVIETSTGGVVKTAVRRYEFVSAEQESSSVAGLIFPLLAGVFGLLVVGMGFQFLVLRNRPLSNLPLGSPRSYGFSGGGVCPQCHRAISLHWWAPNLGFRTKFDHCNFCGKWSIIKLLSRSELAAAEAAELQQVQPAQNVQAKTEEERLKEMIERSRYTH
jgi:hypothetical protein